MDQVPLLNRENHQPGMQGATGQRTPLNEDSRPHLLHGKDPRQPAESQTGTASAEGQATRTSAAVGPPAAGGAGHAGMDQVPQINREHHQPGLQRATGQRTPLDEDPRPHLLHGKGSRQPAESQIGTASAGGCAERTRTPAAVGPPAAGGEHTGMDQGPTTGRWQSVDHGDGMEAEVWVDRRSPSDTSDSDWNDSPRAGASQGPSSPPPAFFGPESEEPTQNTGTEGHTTEQACPLCPPSTRVYQAWGLNVHLAKKHGLSASQRVKLRRGAQPQRAQTTEQGPTTGGDTGTGGTYPNQQTRQREDYRPTVKQYPCAFCTKHFSRHGLTQHQKSKHRTAWFQHNPSGKSTRESRELILQAGRQRVQDEIGRPPVDDDALPPSAAPSPVLRPWHWAATQDIFCAQQLHLRHPSLLEHIPADLRRLAGAALMVPQNRILSHPQCPGGWFVLLMFPLWCLRLTPGKPSRAQSYETQDRLRRYLKGEWEDLQHEFAEQARIFTDREPEGRQTTLEESAKHQEETNIKRALKLIKAGELSKAAQALTPTDPAPQNETTKAALQALHPPPQEEIPDWVAAFAPQTGITIDTKTYLRAYASAPRLSKPGPSGWTFEMIRDIYPEEAGDTGQLQIGAILGQMVAGNIPECVAQAMASSRLRALKKPHSEGVRPVAIGEVWTRMASRAIMGHLRDEFHELLLPYQMGVAVPGGSEAVVLGIRAALEANPDWTLVAVDISNAFNSISRCAIFEALRDGGPQLQQLIPYARAQYGNPTPLWYKDGPRSVHRILSRTGTRQGDPLAGALFALGHLRALKNTRATNPRCFLPTIADDTYILGPVDAVEGAYVKFVEETHKLALQVKPSKCCQFVQEGASPASRDRLIPNMTHLTDGITVLGTPVGTMDYIGEFFRQAAVHKSRGLHLLPKFDDAQAAHSLLSKCFQSRMHYLLRCTPLTQEAGEAVAGYHERLVECMEEVLGWLPGSMPLQARAQLQLSVAKGGLGFIPPLVVAPAAFLGSWALSSSRLRTMFPGDAPIGEFIGNVQTGGSHLQQYLQGLWHSYHALIPDLPPLVDMAAEPLNKFQARCSSKKSDSLAETFLASLQGQADKARFLSVSSRHAGAWLEAGGFHADTTLDNQVFQTAVKIRLGLPHREMQGVPTCPCGRRVDALGQHHLHCTEETEIVHLHNSARDVLASIFRRAGYQVQTEKLGELMESAHTAPGQKTDLVLQKSGHKILCDVAFRSPTAPCRLHRTADTPLMAAQDGETAKEDKYRQRPPGVRFIAAAFEPYGAWGRDISRFLSSLRPHIITHNLTNPKIHKLQGFLYQSLSAAIARGAAISLLSKFRTLHRQAGRENTRQDEETTTELLAALPLH